MRILAWCRRMAGVDPRLTAHSAAPAVPGSTLSHAVGDLPCVPGCVTGFGSWWRSRHGLALVGWTDGGHAEEGRDGVIAVVFGCLMQDESCAGDGVQQGGQGEGDDAD